jgi:ssDNA-binding Zn-finger/Zn-ribbon topoisomerase 1
MLTMETVMPLTKDNHDDYWGNRCPKCPHCDKDIDVSRHELHALYEEGEHEIECPYCDKAFRVSVRVSHSYDTSIQPQRLTDSGDGNAR